MLKNLLFLVSLVYPLLVTNIFAETESSSDDNTNIIGLLRVVASDEKYIDLLKEAGKFNIYYCQLTEGNITLGYAELHPDDWATLEASPISLLLGYAQPINSWREDGDTSSLWLSWPQLGGSWNMLGTYLAPIDDKNFYQIWDPKYDGPFGGKTKFPVLDDGTSALKATLTEYNSTFSIELHSEPKKELDPKLRFVSVEHNRISNDVFLYEKKDLFLPDKSMPEMFSIQRLKGKCSIKN